MTNFRLLSLALGLLIIVSCEDNLEENPQSFIASENFYNSEEDAEAAIYSIYHRWTKDHSRNMYIMNAIPTDEGVPRAGGSDPLDLYQYGPTHGTITEMWWMMYMTISRANVALNRISGIEMNENNKKALLAEARFMRAMAYFRLVRFYGDVPLILDPTVDMRNVNVERTPTATVYEQIIEDLEYAELNLPDPGNTEEGRPSSLAATGILARVYLTRQEWSMAAQKAKEVIDSGKFDLMEDFPDVFRPETQPNQENIFVMNFVAGMPGDQQWELKYYLPTEIDDAVARGLGRYVPSKEHLYDTYEEGDLRRDWTMWTSFTHEGETWTFAPHWHKFMDYATLDNTDDNNNDIPLLRYAHILLIYAEALNEMNGPTEEAYEALNQIKRRAYGENVKISSSVDYEGLNQSEFRQAIYQERKWEFAGEWIRWFDLKRTGRLIPIMTETMDFPIPERYLLFPIPQREMDANPNLVQNPGY